MKVDRKFISRTVAMFLALLLMQAYVGLGFAAPPTVNAVIVSPQQMSGILSTELNRPIIVNGASVTSGATILTGAMIEVPGGMSATVNFPGHGTLIINENTKLSVEFSNAKIRVNLIQGCIVLQTKTGTAGEVLRGADVIGTTDGSKDDSITTCPDRGAIPTGGLSTGAKVGITLAAIGGTATILAFALRGDDPSPSSPSS